MSYFLTKTIEGRVKDVDMSKNTVTLYYSNFGSIDSDGDIVDRKAFNKTVKEWGPKGANRIKHWKSHNPDQVIGKPLEMFQDSTGAGAVSWLGSKQIAKDALLDYQEGLITEHSFGYNIMDSEIIKDDNGKYGHQILKEIKQFEYSAVAFGANEHTPVVDFKSVTNEVAEKWFDDQFNTITKLTKASKIGEYSDEKLIGIEHSILVITKQIQQAILDKFAQSTSIIEIEQIAANENFAAINYLKQNIDGIK